MALDQSQEKEATIRATIEESPGAGAAAGSLLERAQKIQDTLENKGPHATIESLRPPVEEQTARFNLEHAFSSGLDANGRTVQSREQQGRYAEARKFYDIATTFIKDGYPRLSARDRGLITTRIIQAVRAWPEGDEIFRHLATDAERQAAIRRLLENPDFAAKVRNHLGEVLNKAEEASHSDDLEQKQRDHEGAHLEAEAAETERYRQAGEWRMLDDQYEPYKEVTRTGVKGHLLDELDTLNAGLAGFESTIRNRQRELSRIDDEIADLNRDRRAAQTADERQQIQEDIRTQRDRRNTVQEDIDGAQEQINRLQTLQAEKARIEERRNAIQANLVESQKTANDKIRDLSLKNIDLQKARNAHTLNEQVLQNDLRNVFSEAAFEYLKEKVDESQAENDRLREEEIKNAETEDDRNILNALGHRYVDVDRNPRRDVIDREYEMLFRLNGAKEIFEAMYRGTNRYPPASPEYVSELARINERLKDPEFIQKYEPRVAQEILSRRIQTGRISEQDAQFIMNSQWGQGMIEEGLRKRNDIREQVENLVGERVIDPGFFRKLRESSGGNLVMILLLLFGTVATAGMLKLIK